nr:PREDICTED: motile sperm domain-containing protein 2 isoform X2 [Latimeria chalumnae]|eukprot:XP_014352344.1 PREDICTED: motile sperm domain-containing protein 2 isoform X2 [Latimeria chalumnae]
MVLLVSPMEMAEQEKEKLIKETRQRFTKDYLQDKADKYDSRDVERLQTDDAWVESYLLWRHNILHEALKMIDESFQWRKEFGVNDLSESVLPRWTFETGAVFLHGYDKEGNKLFWFKVKLHIKDAKTALEKKKYVAFWLERYAKREPGKYLTVVFDMMETGLSNIDMDFVRFVINCFKIYYPKYLSAWKIVRSWLGPEAVSKLKFASRSEIQEYISVEYLPPHMGGIDPFKYSYPPLPDDDFQTPMCENGPIVSEDETEMKDDAELESKDTVDSNHNEEQMLKSKKVTFTEEVQCKQEEHGKMKSIKKPVTVFKGPLVHISPAEELHFGSKESGERKCLIILNNVTKNPVAFKVRTTAPEKYRVKPSNSSCEAGASLDIVVSLHGGSEASPQDRFLVMAAEIDQPVGAGTPDLAQFWKELPRNKVMEHRLRCHVVESNKPAIASFSDSTLGSIPSKDSKEHLHLKLTKLLASNARLEEQINQCIWFQQLLGVLVSLLVAITCSCLYLLLTNDDSK